MKFGTAQLVLEELNIRRPRADLEVTAGEPGATWNLTLVGAGIGDAEDGRRDFFARIKLQVASKQSPPAFDVAIQHLLLAPIQGDTAEVQRAVVSTESVRAFLLASAGQVAVEHLRHLGNALASVGVTLGSDAVGQFERMCADVGAKVRLQNPA